MGLSKVKTRLINSAVKKFTDRDEPRDVFSTAYANLSRGNNPFKVLMYYGVGGIGKTSLLHHLRQSILDDDVTSVFVNLEASNYYSFADILLDIRRQLPGKYPLFEYAFARHLSIQGRSLDDINKSYLNKDSILFDFQELASDLAEVVAPARLILRLIESGKEKYKKLSEEFKEIDGLRDDELEEKLPFYLGVGIEKNHSSDPMKLVVFIDTHEATMWRDTFKSTKREGDEWLSEFIGSSENGLYVIAGRERLRWGDINPEWDEYLEQHILGSLADVDADEFLRGIPVLESDIRSAIIDTASGVPLYLDLCASTYLHRKKSGKPLAEEDFHMHEDEVIERFLAHLDRDQEQAIRVMSIPNIFDIGLFKEVITSLNINYPLSLFAEFCDSSYAVPLKELEGVYKIHSIVRDYVYDESSVEVSKIVALAILHSSEVSFKEEQFERASWVFCQAWTTIESLHLVLSNGELSRFLSLAIGLIEAGQWLSIQGALQSSQVSNHSEQLESLSVFVLAICARKTGCLEEADALYRKALSMGGVYEDHYHILRYYSAHTAHLLGQFDRAVDEYEDIMNLNCSTSICSQAKDLSERQYYDVQMIKGHFKTTKEKFLEIENKRPDSLWEAEVSRFLGHIERFNFRFQEAEGLYREAKKLAEGCKGDAMLGKALTNLAETLCWLAPHTATEVVDKAIELNKSVKAPIEVGKAIAAQSLALTFTKSYDEAILAAKKSYEIQKESGYRNGLLYALLAEGVARYFTGNIEKVKDIIGSMDAITEEVGVYGFLKLPLLLAVEPNQALKEYSQYEWLDVDHVIYSHRSYMKLT